MEDKVENPQGPRTENAKKFLNTFETFINQIDPNWINERIIGPSDIIIIYTLGSGASNVETDALNYLFPNAKKFAVDIDDTGKDLAKHFGFEFIKKSADDPNIYKQQDGQELKPNLVIIRNPKPIPKPDFEMWVRAIKIAWEKMQSKTILYLTASTIELPKVTAIVSQALGIPEEEIRAQWKTNPEPLGRGAFPDQIVLCLQKK